MVLHERPIQFDIVSTSAQRRNAFTTLLGPEKVRQVAPKFGEHVIRRPINHQAAEWPFEMAEHKALQDISTLMVIAANNEIAKNRILGDIKVDGKQTIRLYSDTVQVVFNTDMSDDDVMVLEKPNDLESWLDDDERGAMAQSGKRFEIATALTGIDVTNANTYPSTILIRITGKMKPYTKKDILNILDNHGPQDILTTAGGISIQNSGTNLYDKTKPLACYIQTDPNAQPTLVFELPTWENVDIETLRRYVYGAIPEAVTTLLRQIENSRYVKSTSKKKDMISPYPSQTENLWNKPQQ